MKVVFEENPHDVESWQIGADGKITGVVAADLMHSEVIGTMFGRAINPRDRVDYVTSLDVHVTLYCKDIVLGADVKLEGK